MKSQGLLLLIGSFTCVVFECSFSQDTEPAIPTKAPKIHLQVLNGISPHPVDIAINNTVYFANAKPGARFSAMGLPEAKFTLTIIDKKKDLRKKIFLKLEEGEYYTLVLTGDFKILSPPVPEKSKNPDVRVFAHVLNNKNNPGESPVRVRVVNGLLTEPVSLHQRNGKSHVVQPMNIENLAGLPDNLFMKATVGQTSHSLYLGQNPPVKNIAIVFYPNEKGFSFRAMTESTAISVGEEARKNEKITLKELSDRNQPLSQ